MILRQLGLVCGFACATAVADDCVKALAPRTRTRRHVELDRADVLVDRVIVPKMKARLIAQPQIVDALARQLYRARGAGTRRGMMGAVLLFGPTGVGKNLAGEVLSELIGGKLIELEGGNFQTSADVSSLTGASPQWAGHGKTSPALTQARVDAARGTELPITIVMINEIDKAHRSFIDWWLKGMDVGENVVWSPLRTDGSTNPGAERRVIDLRNVLLIATTNAGAAEVRAAAESVRRWSEVTAPDAIAEALGYADLANPFLEDAVFAGAFTAALNGVFHRPEFLGRFDEVVPAWPILPRGMRRVAEAEIRRVGRAFRSAEGARTGPRVRLSPQAVTWVVDQLSGDFGARGLSKLIDRLVTTPLSKAVATEAVGANDVVYGRVLGDRLAFTSLTVLSPMTSKVGDINHLRDPSLTEPQRLDKMLAFVESTASILPAQALELLTLLPRSQDWGHPTNKVPAIHDTHLGRLGLGQWTKLNQFMYLDLSITVSVLARLTSLPSNGDARALRDQAIDIVAQSLGVGARQPAESGEERRIRGSFYILISELIAEARARALAR